MSRDGEDKPRVSAVDPTTRRINYVSVSSVGAFDPEQEGGCERWWFYKYIEKRPDPQTPQQALGVRGHGEIEHYLKTGEDVLGPIARAGKHFIPRPGSDLGVEIAFRPEAFNAARASGAPLDDLRLTTLTARVPGDEIPFLGYMDLKNPRGEYLDAEGNLRETPGQIEVCDWKFTGDLGYAKSGPKLMSTIQMPGYGELQVRQHPDASSIRLSHVYFRTKGAPLAKKTTIAVEPERIRTRWESIERTVARMVDVAKEVDASRVSANLKSCRRYNKPCPAAAYCPKSANETLIDIFGGKKTMSILDDIFGSAPVTPATPAPTPTPAPSAPASGGITDILGAMGVAAAPTTPTAPAVDPVVAAELARLQAFEAELKANGEKIRAAGAVTPPDAPTPTAAQVADPVPPEAALGLMGALKLAVGDHTAAVASETATPATEAEAPAKAKRGRKPKAETTATAPATEAPPAPAAEAPPSTPTHATVTSLGELAIFADVDVVALPASMRGMLEPLEPYIERVCDALAKAGNAVEIRCAPDGPLAFGKWKGALAAAVKAAPPDAGYYTLSWVGEDERKQVVLDALRGVASLMVRGVR